MGLFDRFRKNTGSSTQAKAELRQKQDAVGCLVHRPWYQVEGAASSAGWSDPNKFIMNYCGNCELNKELGGQCPDRA